MEATSVPAPTEYVSILIPPSYIDETLLGQLLSLWCQGNLVSLSVCMLFSLLFQLVMISNANAPSSALFSSKNVISKDILELCLLSVCRYPFFNMAI